MQEKGEPLVARIPASTAVFFPALWTPPFYCCRKDCPVGDALHTIGKDSSFNPIIFMLKNQYCIEIIAFL